jgi:hypothetical protein
MATATVTLVNRVLENALQAGDRGAYTAAQVIQIALNPAVREVAAAALTNAKSTTIAVVAGTQDYAISSLVAPFFKSSAILWGPTRRPVVYRDNSIIQAMTYSGEPEFWTLFDNKLRLGPRVGASGTLYVDAYGGPPPLVETTPASGADELGWRADAEDVAVLRASQHMCTLVGEGERGRDYERMFVERLALLRQVLAPDDDAVVRIPIASAWDDGLEIY